MYFYSFEDTILLSNVPYNNLERITEKAASEAKGKIFLLNGLDPLKSRRSFSVSDLSLIFQNKEDLNLLILDNDNNNKPVPHWLLEKIRKREVTSLNTQYPNWTEVLKQKKPQKWRINIMALGDVGGTLLMGLRLLGGENISEIGIYDRSENKIKRWEYEMNQVFSPFANNTYPNVYGITKEDLFDCDMFVFCASKGVPPVGSTTGDVRMVQFKGNSQIISEYAKMARDKGFKGIFSVVSDPVDLLCKVVLLESNKNADGEIDFMGLAPEQIRGYGLGVMNARAVYYAKKNPKTLHYLTEGRAFGPHGEGLIIANSIENYSDYISLELTEAAKNANLEIRNLGFKPFMAPALSSGSLSILATISGDWHYSATFIGGVFMGAKNRLTDSGIELERIKMPDPLLKRLENTYERLANII